MAYTALYRKLRPKVFDDVIGQEHIVRTLKNQLAQKRISHAYLFCGTRGTGKTSTAKIFAQAVNCTSLEEGEPCGKCQSCVSIIEKRSMNVIEIDAASNNGVENIRDLREEVKYPPTDGLYKVYIIDEVHMLSTGAFNALLKTLEEPPLHVMFILATTDPQKVPPTIQSRCQRFDFKRISVEDIVSTLKKYMKEENVNIDDDALTYIALLSDGAMRDALSIIDQCISFHFGEAITLQKVLDIVGSVDKSVFFELTDALIDFNSLACLKTVEELIMAGRDISQFITELVNHFRNLLVAKLMDHQTNSIDISMENFTKIREQAEKLSNDMIIHFIQMFSQLQAQIKYASNERILLEVACIKACNPEVIDHNEGIIARLDKLEKGVPFSHDHGAAVPEVKKAKVEEKIQTKPKAAIPDFEVVKNKWTVFTEEIEVTKREILKLSQVDYLEGNMMYIVCTDPSSSNVLNKSKESILAKLNSFFNKEFDVTIIDKPKFDEMHTSTYGKKPEEMTVEVLNEMNVKIPNLIIEES